MCTANSQIPVEPSPVLFDHFDQISYGRVSENYDP